jgi:RNA polymerase sigma-70 factor, ECF subfamily
VPDGPFPFASGPQRGDGESPAHGVQPVFQGSPAAADEMELVRRARDNDPWAADQLVRRYQKKVYGIAYQICGFDPEEARDTAQEALLQVFRNLGQFEGRSRFSTWLHRIAVNACLDARRRRKRWFRMILPRRTEKRDEGDPEDPIDNFPAPEGAVDPVASLRGAELKRDVTDALRGLSDHQRTVFQLKVFQEMSIPEIAAVTGMAEGTVKSHLFRATQSVREQLRQWVDR